MAWTTGRPINTNCLVSASRGVLGALSTRKVFEEGGGGLSIGKNTVALRVLQHSGFRSILRNVKILEFLKFYNSKTLTLMNQKYGIRETQVWIFRGKR